MEALQRIPPQALQIEDAVISALLIDYNAMSEVIEILKPEMFYSPENSLIFTACFELYRDNKPIDLLTVTEQLRVMARIDQAGGVLKLSEKAFKLSSAANIVYHSQILKEKYLLRMLSNITAIVYDKCFNETIDVFELLSEIENNIFNLTKDNTSRKIQRIIDLYYQQIKNIEAKKEGHVIGYLTNLPSIDNLLKGIKKQNLIILAARPSQGKTALAMTIATNLAVKQQVPVGFFSMEMSAEELCSRFTALNSGIPLNYLVNSDVKGIMFERVMQGIPTVKAAPLFIDDSEALTMMKLRSRARTMVLKYGVKFIFVDYIGLMKPNFPNKTRTKENEVSEISNGLKSLAKELDVPVFALSQLNREVEKRTDKRPQLSDIRDSGSVEQDADVVMFLFRPEYYKITTTQNGEQIPDGYSEAIFAKHRNGPLGDIGLRFIKECAKFEELNQPAQTIQYESGGEYKSNTVYEQPF